MRHHVLTLLGAGLLMACSSNSETAPAGPLAPPPEGQGFQLSLEYEAPPGEETWICEVKAMPNVGIANVNRVESEQTDGTHHLTLSTLSLSGSSNLEYGIYDCNELYGDSSLMENQTQFYGNAGDTYHEMQFPKGIAAPVPGGLDVIHEMHFVNTTKEPIQIESRLNAWTIEQSEVEAGMFGGNVRDETISIPPKSEHTEWSRCVFNRDLDVLVLASHMHELGKNFTIRHFDGKEVGDVIFTNDDWHIPLITQYDPPLPIKKGEGFEWSCTFKNPSDKEVNYGSTASDEMCNLSHVFSPFDLNAICEVVETSDGVLWQPGD